MALGTGLNTQLGLVEETVYGTPVTVTRFPEILSESLELRTNIIQSSALRAGARSLRRGSRRVQSSRDGGGDITMEVATKGMGIWFKHMLGGTPSVVQQGGTIAYLQTHTLGDTDGKSLTIQKGVAQTDGTVKPFTFHGCKITGWEFSISVDAMLQLRVSVDAEDVDTATALATASYTTANVFNFMQGAITVGGAPVAQVLDATVTGENPMKTDRYYLGSAGLKKEPLANDFATIGGSLTAEFTDLTTFHDRFRNDTAAALVLTFTGSEIVSGQNETLTITVPEIRFTGETPKVGGPDVVVQNAGFEAQYDGTNPGLTLTYKSSDTAI